MFALIADVSINKKAKQQIAETMTNENKKQDPSKDVHLQALKIFINLFPHGEELLLVYMKWNSGSLLEFYASVIWRNVQYMLIKL